MSAVKKWRWGGSRSPKGQCAFRRVRTKQREAAVHKVDLGSTALTAVEIQTALAKELTAVEVLGVLESEEEGRLYLVLEDDVQYEVEASLWEPHEEELLKRRLFVVEAPQDWTIPFVPCEELLHRGPGLHYSCGGFLRVRTGDRDAFCTRRAVGTKPKGNPSESSLSFVLTLYTA
ncbi:uncharacterized protein ACNS7B_006046 [Menidia menidia]